MIECHEFFLLYILRYTVSGSLVVRFHWSLNPQRQSFGRLYSKLLRVTPREPLILNTTQLNLTAYAWC